MSSKQRWQFSHLSFTLYMPVDTEYKFTVQLECTMNFRKFSMLSWHLQSITLPAVPFVRNHLVYDVNNSGKLQGIRRYEHQSRWMWGGNCVSWKFPLALKWCEIGLLCERCTKFSMQVHSETYRKRRRRKNKYISLRSRHLQRRCQSNFN